MVGSVSHVCLRWNPRFPDLTISRLGKNSPVGNRTQ
jgi:hypothetical protein